MKNLIFLALFSGFCNLAMGQITANVTEGCFPLTVDFEANIALTGYVWDFGDGSTSTLEDPSNIFGSAGAFEVTLTDPATNAIVSTINIDVFERLVPTATIAPSLTGCAPFSVEFTNTTPVLGGITVQSAQWVFGDGNMSNDLNASNIYASPGSFDVTLEVTANIAGCEGTAVVETIEVVSPPNASFSTGPLTSCTAPLTVDILNNSTGTNLEYDWTFGSTIPNTDVEEPGSIVYDETGNFQIALTVTDPVTQCTDTQIENVAIGAPSFSFSQRYSSGIGSFESTLSAGDVINNDSLCAGSYTVSIDNPVSSASFTWQNSVGQSNNANYTFSIPDSRFDTLTLISEFTTGGATCSDTSTQIIFYEFYDINSDERQFCDYSTPNEIEINLTPQNINISTLEVNGVPQVYNNSGQLIFTEPFDPLDTRQLPVSLWHDQQDFLNPTGWEDDENFPGGIQETIPYSDIIVDTSFLYNYNTEHVFTINTESSLGCLNETTSTNEVFPITAIFYPDTTQGCAPLNVTFQNFSYPTPNEDIPVDSFEIVEYLWEFGDGNTLVTTNQDDIDHVYQIAGEYPARLTAFTAEGCRDVSYEIIIRVGNPIPGSFTVSNTNVCINETVTLTNTSSNINIDAANFNADHNRSFHCSDERTVEFQFSEKVGDQDIVFQTNSNGCIAETTQSITVTGAVSAFDFLQDCSNPMDVTFTNRSTPGASYEWDFGNGTTSTNFDPGTITYASSGDFNVRLIASADGCTADTTFRMVNVRNVQADFDVFIDGVRDSLVCANEPVVLNAFNSLDNVENEGFAFHYIFNDEPGRGNLVTPMESDLASFTMSGPQTISLVVLDINGCRDTTTRLIEVFNIEPTLTLDKDGRWCLGKEIEHDVSATTADTLITRYQLDYGYGTGVSRMFITNGTLENLSDQDTSEFAYNFVPSNINSTVNLTVFDTLGCSNSVTADLEFYTITAGFTASDISICEGEDVVFTNATTGNCLPLTFDWTIENSSVAVSEDLTFTFNDNGFHSINLDVEEFHPTTNSSCEASAPGQSITVQSTPQAAFSFEGDDQPFICSFASVLGFENTTTTNPLDTTFNPLNPFVASINLDTSAPGSWISFDVPRGDDFQRGTTVVGVAVSSIPSGCQDTIFRNVVVAGPEATLSVDNNLVCRGEPVTFSFSNLIDVAEFDVDFGNGLVQTIGVDASGTIPDVSSVEVIYDLFPANNSASFIATLVPRDLGNVCNGNVASTETVSLHQVIADFERNNNFSTPDTSRCLGEPFQIFNRSTPNVDNFFWDFGNGQTASDGGVQMPNYTSPGVFPITLGVSDNETGCTDTITRPVVVIATPMTQAVGDTVCLGDNAVLTLLNPEIGNTIQWSPTSFAVGSTMNPNLILQQVTETTEYIVSETSPLGCDGLDTVSVVVIPQIEAQNLDTTVFRGSQVVLPLDLQPFNNVVWTPSAEGLSDSIGPFPIVAPIEFTTFTATVTDDFGCFIDVFEFNIDIHPEEFLAVPTAFTPTGANADNQTFNLLGVGIREIEYFRIFNRYGELVFETNNLEEGWDGTFRGELQNMDTYVYKAKAITFTDQIREVEGHFTLIR